jgi:urea carboxylase-associated protein 2
MEQWIDTVPEGETRGDPAALVKESGLPGERIRFQEILPGGAKWSHVLKRHTTLRITARGAEANVSALFYNFELLSERYNMADTLKAQHTALLTKGHCLYSDMGRVLVSITGDTVGWHDPICGCSTPETIRRAYGEGRYQEKRNRFHRSGRENFIVELGKYGLGVADVVANVNFFSKVTVGEAGELTLQRGHSRAGDYVDLRAEMNTLVVLAAVPHPLAPAGGEYDPAPALLTVWNSDPPRADDYCRNFRPENQRGFEVTERYFL